MFYTVHNKLQDYTIGTQKNQINLLLLFSRIQGAGLGGMKPNTVILGWPNCWRKREEESWRVFVDTIRNTAAAKMALLVPKGVQRYPDSGVSFFFFLLNSLGCLAVWHGTTFYFQRHFTVIWGLDTLAWKTSNEKSI